MLELILSSLLIMSASLVGVFSIWKKFGDIIERNLKFLVSLSAGVFLFIAYNLGHEAIEIAPSTSLSLAWMLAGIVIVYTIFKILPSFHHHHDEHEEFKDHDHCELDTKKILISDAIHNIADGILLVSSFSISTSLGLITVLGIFVHEIIQETSEFFILKEGGFTTKKALFVNFLISSTILIGSVGGYYLINTFETLEFILLSMAAGSFLIVVLHDLIPHSIRTSKHKTHYLKHFVFFCFGILIMSGINSLTSGSHSHDNHEEYENHEEDHEEDRDHI